MVQIAIKASMLLGHALAPRADYEHDKSEEGENEEDAEHRDNKLGQILTLDSHGTRKAVDDAIFNPCARIFAARDRGPIHALPPLLASSIMHLTAITVEHAVPQIELLRLVCHVRLSWPCGFSYPVSSPYHP